jgi:hypothetical protein
MYYPSYLVYEKCNFASSIVSSNESVKDFEHHHQAYIEEWYKYEQNTMRIFCMHSDRAFIVYLGWNHQVTRIKMHQRWTDDDYADVGSSSSDDTIYDTRTWEGSHV